MIREELRIRITALHDGAALRMPDDPTLRQRLKERFPAARWGGVTSSWHVPGKFAGRRLELWAAEQSDHLRAIEQGRREAEWATPEPISQQAGSPAPRREALEWIAIPGQPARRERAPMPPDAPDAATAALRDLSADLGRRSFAGFLRNKVYVSRFWPSAIWQVADEACRPAPELATIALGGLTSSGRLVPISWTWGAIHGGPNWQRDGWHPDHNYDALSRPHAIAIYRALNPGTLVIPRHKP